MAEFEYSLLIVHNDQQVTEDLVELFRGQSADHFEDSEIDIRYWEFEGMIRVHISTKDGPEEEERKLFIHTASSAQEYRMLWRDHIHHAVLLNLTLPEDPLSVPSREIGMNLLKEIRHDHPNSEVIVFTDQMVASPAIEAIRNGAFYFIQQPCIHLEFVQALVARIIQMTEGAYLDTLTGLYNRRFFESSLKNFWEESVGSGERGRRDRGGDLSLILIDLIDFRVVNDRYLHKGGDAALLHAARFLGACFRKTDILSRIGGDEFAVIVPYTDHRRALEAAERTRQQIQTSSLHLMHKTNNVIENVTFAISAGVATYPTPNTASTMDDLVKAADEALYHAKEKSNKNVVCGYDNDGQIFSFSEVNS